MNKRELKRRGKGLLALLLAFTMMFGSSMTVLAGTTYVLGWGGGLTVGQELKGGDIIQNAESHGDIKITIDGNSYDDKNGTIPRTIVLPGNGDYYVVSYDARFDGYFWFYSVALRTTPKIQPGGNGNTSTESNNDDTKSENVSPELSEEEQYIARLRSEYWENHVHTFSWVTTREATAGQDGIQENRCSCGLVQDTTVIPASQTFVQEYYDVVRNAPANGTVSYDSGSLHTLSDKMLKYLSERSDVAVEVSFVYQGTAYKMTIPAGCDYSALLSDEDAFYGYFYFAQQTGAKIEPVA